VVTHLKKEIQTGRWTGHLPGVPYLMRDLGVPQKMLMTALTILEKERYVSKSEPGRRRRILSQQGNSIDRSIRIAILDYEPLSLSVGYMVELQHGLEAAGFRAFFTDKCLLELNMSVQRLARMVEKTPADAWVVCAGTKEILQWFIHQEIPAYAFCGRRRELPVAGAGPDKEEAFRVVVRRLVELGHRKIVLIALNQRRFPHPGAPERAFLDELKAHGIIPGEYNLPDWDNRSEGLRRLLDELFRVTPPTALLIDEAYLFHAAKHYLAYRGIHCPDQVSLVCTDPDRTFDWCYPSISHIRWDPSQAVRAIMRWANAVAQGKEYQRQILTVAEFVEGGTIGPAPAETTSIPAIDLCLFK